MATSLPEPQDEDRVPSAVGYLSDEASGKLGPWPTEPRAEPSPDLAHSDPLLFNPLYLGCGGCMGRMLE